MASIGRDPGGYRRILFVAPDGKRPSIRLAKKLANVGLISKPEVKAATTLKPFLKAYIDGRADLKPATKIVQGQVIRDLTEFFGDTRDVRIITGGLSWP